MCQRVLGRRDTLGQFMQAAGHPRAVGQMLCVLWLGDTGLLGAELPCCISKYFLPLHTLEEQNSLEMSASHPSQLAFHRGHILSSPGCDSGLLNPTSSLLFDFALRNNSRSEAASGHKNASTQLGIPCTMSPFVTPPGRWEP